MTCIVGYAKGGSVWIAGDSAGVDGWSVTVRADKKVFVRTDGDAIWAFGFTTSYRMGQALRYHVELPTLPADLDRGHDDDDLERFMVRRFVPALRDGLREAGWLKRENEREEGGDFLVGVAGQLFLVSSDFQVARSSTNYMSVGSGSAEAMGALVALDRHTGDELHPIERLRSALVAAEALNIGVRGPFEVAVSGARHHGGTLATHDTEGP